VLINSEKKLLKLKFDENAVVVALPASALVSGSNKAKLDMTSAASQIVHSTSPNYFSLVYYTWNCQAASKT